MEPTVYWSPPASDLKSSTTAWSQLHQSRTAEATKPFLARGHRISRCDRCLLSPCFCTQRKAATSKVDFVLIYHRNEVLKPTNTGRLIADCFPANTWACTWHRTQVPKPLLELLNNPARQPVLVFPGEHNPTLSTTPNVDEKRRLLVVLDGTWKQARKMYLQSPWLHSIPAMSLTNQDLSLYGLRQAPNNQQLATVEAVGQALAGLQKHEESQLLANYFNGFTQHYRAMRSNINHHNTTELKEGQ